MVKSKENVSLTFWILNNGEDFAMLAEQNKAASDQLRRRQIFRDKSAGSRLCGWIKVLTVENNGSDRQGIVVYPRS